MTVVLFLVLLLTLYVALGRSAQPAADRLPLSALSVRDVAHTARLGFQTLNRRHAERWGSAIPSSAEQTPLVAERVGRTSLERSS
ncbi:hypothetical protein PU560_10155 [Georgenia sp. 10Sc9-8]|uniref:Secreted protein n=1 Tax=Georgenia halotolerans TaxID=3028317 RepID=A0ABT5TXM9_9MICO|nr:hypothetical protein [Georgenia halotolerans]